VEKNVGIFREVSEYANHYKDRAKFLNCDVEVCPTGGVSCLQPFFTIDSPEAQFRCIGCNVYGIGRGYVQRTEVCHTVIIVEELRPHL
jgi:hypothetical protein